MDEKVKGVKLFRKEPERFMTDALGLNPDHIWPKMQEVMDSVRDNQKTAVKAGHSVSKTFTAARLVLQFLYCYGPHATVVTTAPTDKQVVEVLWREIRDAKNSAIAKLPGEILTQQLNIGDKWFATGFSTRPDTVTGQATAFQGYHNEYVLVIFDEAAGIMPQIWQAAESLITNDRCRWLVIGNPTSAYGDFAACFKPDSDWNKITISVLDTPNYKEGREIVPSLAGRDFELMMSKKYGKGSNTYLSRVLGEIPEYAEGAIFGQQVKLARESGRILENIPHDTSSPVHTAWDLGISDAMAIWFFQRVGQEIHVIDYVEHWGEGLIWYIDLLHAKREQNGWIYGTHIAPHDIMVRQLTDGATRFETAAKMGINFTICGKPGEKGVVRVGLEDGIEAARQELNRCWFDKSTCEQGLMALSEYHWKKLETVSTDDKPIYSRQPVHDASSNGADAFRYMCLALKYNLASLSAGKNTHSDWSEFYSSAG